MLLFVFIAMRGTVAETVGPSPGRGSMLHRCGVEPVPLYNNARRATGKVVFWQRCAYRARSGNGSARCREHATKQPANAMSPCAVRHNRNSEQWSLLVPERASSTAAQRHLLHLRCGPGKATDKIMVDHVRIRVAEPSDVDVLVHFNFAMAKVSKYATSWVSSPCFVYHRALAKLTHQHSSVYAGDGRYQSER